MDYVLGSVAALISGNVTPNRPKLVRRALTPTKHQPSPNVTPKSELVEDRSIFLSPTQQKKKAIVKKSPKRIFQNPDLDATEDCEGNSSLASPLAEKVKKHLKDELEADDMGKKKSSLAKSPSSKLDKSLNEVSLKNSKIIDNFSADSTPKKKKKKKGNSELNITDSIADKNYNTTVPLEISNVTDNAKTPKKKCKSITEIQTEDTESSPTHSPNKQKNYKSNENKQLEDTSTIINQESKKGKKHKKNKKVQPTVETNILKDSKENTVNATEPQKPSKKKKTKKNKRKITEHKSVTEDEKPQEKETENMDIDNQSESDSEEIKSKNIPNPNAITEKDSDSEHDSDDEIESENEQENEKVLENQNQPEESSDEEQESSNKKDSKNQPKEKEVVMTEEEVKRTLFIGNVPFSSKCKKEIKKIFSKYGQIDTIRIRAIPVKDARVTPKLAIIKNELHPERTTVNVYVKYNNIVSVSEALAENNTVLNGNHLRVSRSDSTGAEHDPRCAVFVGNLPFAVEDDTLRSKFEGCGEITSVRIIRDKKTNAGKGFGYVNFASKDAVELALALSEEDLTIKNRIIRVKRCTQQKQGSKPGGGGKWDNQRQGGGKWGSQGQGGGKWGSQGQGGGKWSSQAQGQAGKWSGQGQGGGKWGSQGQIGGKWGSQGQAGGKWGSQGQGKEEGAARRVMNKRKQQDVSNDAPPNKRHKTVNQPSKEKKPRKEFIGMTAEKKKKHKFDKGQKKKKALSEILTKKKP